MMVCTLSVGRLTAECTNHVIIDVLRASTTIITAIANGAKEIIPLSSIHEGFEKRKEGYFLVCEQSGGYVPGYDLDNSPAELVELAEVNGSLPERIALKTTNLTDMLLKVPDDHTAYICSTLNLMATATLMRSLDEDVSITPVGGLRGIADDMAVAVALHNTINDDSTLNEKQIKSMIWHSNTAKHLRNMGYEKDLKCTLRVDMCGIVPVMRNGVIRPQ